MAWQRKGRRKNTHTDNSSGVNSWMIRILLIYLGDVILTRKYQKEISISDGNIIEALPLFAELEYLYEQAGDPGDVVIGHYFYFYQDVVRIPLCALSEPEMRPERCGPNITRVAPAK